MLGMMRDSRVLVKKQSDRRLRARRSRVGAFTRAANLLNGETLWKLSARDQKHDAFLIRY
jgi:hypothetical protein